MQQQVNWSPNSRYRRSPERHRVSIPNVNRGRSTAPPDHFWIPGRSVARLPEPEFLSQLSEVSERLDIGWNPIDHCHEIWVKDPSIRTEYCKGWRRLLKVQKDGEFIPLDGRALAAVYGKDASKFGGAKRYYDRIMAEIARNDESRDKAHKAKTKDMTKDYWDHTKIQISQYGESSGSKFANHHSE